MDINQVTQEFISANSRITQHYFAFTEKVLGLLSNNSNQQQILVQLLTQTESVTQKFLETNQQLLMGNALQPADQALPATEVSRPAAISPMPADAEESIDQWLREKLAEMTGFAAADIDFTLEFEQLGLDSLSHLDLQEALAQRFPHAARAGLSEADTPAKLLSSLSPELNPTADTGNRPEFCADQAVRGAIASLTGFALMDIDLSLTFDALGIDSLGRLDMLEALQSEYPEVSPHVQWLTNLQTPAEMVALLERNLSGAATKISEATLETALFQLLEKFGNGGDIKRETPFSHYLTDGFAQSAVWESLASQYSICQFAGEALMSQPNAGDALVLLNRLGA